MELSSDQEKREPNKNDCWGRVYYLEFFWLTAWLEKRRCSLGKFDLKEWVAIVVSESRRGRQKSGRQIFWRSRVCLVVLCGEIAAVCEQRGGCQVFWGGKGVSEGLRVGVENSGAVTVFE